MTAPNYLQSAFRYLRVTGVVDYATLITSIKDEVLNQLPVGNRWTDLGGDEVRSPIDADGRFVRVDLNRIAATTLEAIITDPDGRTLTRRAQFVGSVAVNIFSGPSYLAIDQENAEGIWVAIMDLWPLSQVAHQRYVVAQGKRDAASADDGTYLVGSVFERNASETYATFTGGTTMQVSHIGAERWLMRSIAGARMGVPFLVAGNATPVRRLVGRVPQALFVPTGTPQGTEIAFTLDEVTTGTFRVTGIPDPTAVLAQIALRRS